MLTHKGTVRIETKRLILRPFCFDDAEAMYHGWMSDERVAKYTSWYAHTDIEQTRSYIGYVLSLESERAYNWVIEFENKPVGTINVCYSDERAEICGIAYALDSDYWGKGIVTEAMKAVAAFLFDCVHYRKIIAGCDSENTGSRRVMEKVGMKQEACLRAQIKRKDGSFGDDLQYGLFEGELNREM